MDEKELLDQELDQEEMENEDEGQYEPDYKALSEQYKAQAEKEKARADKYEGRYKSIKKQEKPESKSDFSEDDVEERVFQRVNFYNQHQGASEYKTEIEALVKDKGLEREDAMKLVLAQKAPEKLVDPAFLNKGNSGNVSMQGTPKANTKELNVENIKSAQTLEELDELAGIA
jgi:hypothetical protein|nr:MAG TPA: hypothetical protein [Caudoviricetes sp.]